MSTQFLLVGITLLCVSWSANAKDFEGVSVPSASVSAFREQQKQWHKVLGKEYSRRERQWTGEEPYGGGEFVFKSNFKATQQIISSETKRVIQETHPSFDESGRRLTVGNNPKNKMAVVLIGDNYVLGDFVNDSQTIASVMKRRLPTSNIYNLGFPGSDPGNFLYHLTDNRPSITNISEPQKTFVYFYSDAYLPRLVGTAEWLNACDCHWKRARYKVVGDELIYQGPHSQRRSFLAPLDRWVTANYGSRFSLTNPPVDASTFVLQAKIFQSLGQTLATDTSKYKFVVYIPPGTVHAKELAAQLRKLHVPFIDHSDLDREALMGADTNDAISQPTSLENEFVALNLSAALGNIKY